MVLEWFEIDVHSMVWDLANEPLLIDDWGVDDECADFDYPEATNSKLH